MAKDIFRSVLIIMACFLFAPQLIFPAIIRVPEDHSTIQEAINAATQGSEIIVSPNLYKENINMKGKNVLLRSTDPTSPSVVASTIIDGQQLDRVITCSGKETDACIISGFTITNGLAGQGGGILGQATKITITFNHITTNTSTLLGGGLYGCAGLIENNVIAGNTANSGGAMAFCNGIIRGNMITGNRANSNHGGAFSNCNANILYNSIIGNYAKRYSGAFESCLGSIQGNIIERNIAEENGGGLYNCDCLIDGNIISDNSAIGSEGRGGGLSYCDKTIQNNIIKNNYAKSFGGGLDLCAEALIQNNIIWNNSAQYGGGITASNGTIQNNVFWGNNASNSYGGIYNCSGKVINCIIWANTAKSDPNIYRCKNVSYCCIERGYAEGIGIIADDPALADPANGDFHLTARSSCIDAGATVTLAMDFEGDPRPYDGTPMMRGAGSSFDIGADEFIPTLSCDSIAQHILAIINLTPEQIAQINPNGGIHIDVTHLIQYILNN